MKRVLYVIATVFSSSFLGGAGSRCLALPPREVVEEMLSNRSTTGSSAASSGSSNGIEVSIEAESDDSGEAARKDIAWLGVSTSEASETLSSQLELPSGVGLVVTYVAHDSGAAKAGLKKHDVLVQFEDQTLVHPAQLRKLVRARAPGDRVQLAFYRAGKRETTTVTLGKLSADFGESADGQGRFQDKLREIESQLKDLHLDDAIREKMNAARDALGKVKLDNKAVQEEIRESMEQARKALRDALKDSTNSDSMLNPMRKLLEEITGTAVAIGNNTTVTVKNSGSGSKSVVKADETGTIVLIANPKLYLTAHDKDGRLLFDGEIDTSEQKDKVPRDLWSKVEPLVDKMNAGAAAEAGAKAGR